MTLDCSTGLATPVAIYERVEQFIANSKEIGYIFFDITDFQELQQIYGKEPMSKLIKHIGETVLKQKGRLFREDDCIVTDPNLPGRFILLLFSPPRHKNSFSDTDLKLVSSRIIQKLKTIVQEIFGYHEAANHIFFNSGYTIIKNVKPGNPEKVLLNAYKDASLQSYSEKIMANLISNISHELRTPLTCIKGYAESLLEGAMYDDGLCAKFIKIINDEAQRLERLINELLDLSMIDARQVQMDCNESDLCELIKDVHAVIQPYAKKAGVRVSCELPENRCLVEIDKDRIKQVIIILVDNAIKYSNLGGYVKIVLEYTGQEAVIKIIDNGIGIPESEKDIIFERFYRVKQKDTVKKAGKGLGLSIAKFIVESHGGEIFVESTYGKGSTFIIKIPVAVQE